MPEESVAEIANPLIKSGVFALPVTPFLGSNQELTRQLFDKIRESETKALVLTGYATGTIPSSLNPFIQETVQGGVPVFILSSNRGEDEGPQRIKYETQKEAVDAGAIILKGVNINKGEEVLAAIQQAIDEGKIGPDLAQVIIDKYGAAA